MITHIKVMPYRYRVEFTPGLRTRSDAAALHDHETITILVDEALKHQHPENDIMHEVFESLKWQMDLRLPHSVLSSLSTGVCTVLRDNPEFTRMFLDE